jgi:hypothetical protein
LPARHLGRSWLAVAAVAPRVAAPRQWPIARGQALRVAIIGCARRAGALDAGAPAVAEQRVRIFGQLATTRSRMSSVARGPMIGRLRGRRTRDRSRHRPSWRMRTCRHGPLNEPCHCMGPTSGVCTVRVPAYGLPRLSAGDAAQFWCIMYPKFRSIVRVAWMWVPARDVLKRQARPAGDPSAQTSRYHVITVHHGARNCGCQSHR